MTTNIITQGYGEQLLFADHSGSFGAAPATAANSLIIGTPVDVQIDLDGVVDGALRESAKTATLEDLVSSNRWAVEWVFGACFEHQSAPTAGTTMTLWWNASPSPTAGTGNSGGATGVDSDYTADATEQLIRIGTMVLKNTAINIDTCVGTIIMPHLYGSLIIENNSGQTHMVAPDEDHVVATPRLIHIEAAV